MLVQAQALTPERQAARDHKPTMQFSSKWMNVVSFVSFAFFGTRFPTCLVREAVDPVRARSLRQWNSNWPLVPSRLGKGSYLVAAIRAGTLALP